MDTRAAVAGVLLISIEVRVYLLTCMRHLRWNELVGGDRLWRIIYARAMRHNISAAHHIAATTLASRRPLSCASTADLPDVLRDAPRVCTWPLRRPEPNVTSSQVMAARLNN